MSLVQAGLLSGRPALPIRPKGFVAGSTFFRSMVVVTSFTLASVFSVMVSATCDKHEKPSAFEGASLLVDIFSGRPNPVYQLTDLESKRIVSALDILDETDKPFKVSERLGFRGFEITSLQINNKHVSLTIVFDQIVISSESGTKTFIDSAQTVHQLLLQFVRHREQNIATAIEESS